jgi:Skp family chaperone for outer membrane proteins
MRGKTFLSVIGLVLALALMAGCAKAPQETVDAAKAAIEAAKAAEADRYLADQFNAAQDSLNAALTEIAAQDSKFALTRNYDRAKALLESAISAAKAAQDGVAAKKEEVKAEAATLLTSAQTAVEETKNLLAKAPRGKEGREVLEQMQTELSGVEGSLAEANNALNSGDFLGARDKAKAAIDKANSLSQELQEAIDKARRR